jgi:ABC-2 type transport system ATP-binding protein
MPKMISITGLNKSFGNTNAVSNLNLTVDSGEFFGFLGPNGAGKTTTIRILTGIINPDSGNVSIAGLSKRDWRKRAQMLGVVPESRGYYDWMTAREYLSFFASLYKIPPTDIPARIEKLLSRVGLTNSRNKKISTFSRGMKQRLGLARALINQPRILILDEPTIGLDPQGQEDIQNLLREVNSDGVTIFYSSHLLHEVSDLCSRIAIINHGCLVAQGALTELMKMTESQTLTEVFLTLTNSKT